MSGGWVYILQCGDGSYYTGCTSNIEQRIAQHQTGMIEGYTRERLPVVPVFHEYFEDIRDAIAAERRIKKWSRAKKEALIRGDGESLKQLAKKRQR